MVSIHDLVVVLKVAIGPVILISGVGLLLLSMTNRFGRVTDRCRSFCEALRETGGEGDGEVRERLLVQLKLFERRARLIRTAIAFAGTSVLLASVLVIALFVASLLNLEVAPLIVLLFAACMATLIASLVVFLRDINVSLAALKVEIESASR